MPFAQVFGANHRNQTIVFGMTIIFDKTTESFVWLISTFLPAIVRSQNNFSLTNVLHVLTLLKWCTQAQNIAFVYGIYTKMLLNI